MRTYQLKRPTREDLQRWAARLSRLDRSALATNPNLARVMARRADSERRQAAMTALPPSWRTRDRARSPEWPAQDDLETWEAIGASHALAMMLPALSPHDQRPCAVAYATGYLTTMQGYTMPEQHPQETIATRAANEMNMGSMTLGCFLSGDVSALAEEYQADVLVALHEMLDLNPLSRAWIVIDGKIYPTAAAASAVRRKQNLECEVVSTDVMEIGDVKLIKCVAECRDPVTGQSERSTSFVSWLVETVDEWGERNGKSFPKSKSWQEPNPEQVADKMMKAQTKAMRRVTLLYAALGSSAAEDVPGRERMYIEQVDEVAPAIAPPHSDEAGA